jgi:uncharacterized DUF497 family protein
MHYEWNSPKDAENFRKHRLFLADGVAALEDPSAQSWVDDRYDYGEERVITLGLGQRGILYGVTTEISEDTTRIISVRKAEASEAAWHRQGHA